MADISRADVATLIQEEYSSSLLTTASAESAVLSVFENVPLGTKITNLPSSLASRKPLGLLRASPRPPAPSRRPRRSGTTRSSC